MTVAEQLGTGLLVIGGTALVVILCAAAVAVVTMAYVMVRDEWKNR